MLMTKIPTIRIGLNYRNLALTANLPNGDYPEYGLHITGNTYYNITVSTDYNRFVTLNNYYPVNISTCN